MSPSEAPSCAWIAENYQRRYSRQQVGAHLAVCRDCQGLTYEFFEELKAEFTTAATEYQAAVARLRDAASRASVASTPPGTAEPVTERLLDLSGQLLDQALKSYAEFPHSSARALGWTQQAFFICRGLESERLVENKATAPLPTPLQKTSYGMPSAHSELFARVTAELHQGKFVHALSLICDPAKHGDMSPLLNFAMIAHVEQIFAVGFRAGALAIRAYCDEHGGAPA